MEGTVDPNDSSKRIMHATREEMDKAEIPYGFRDYCAHLLIPLNKCRADTFYLPWKCEAERHLYEKCEYEEYIRRKGHAIETKRATVVAKAAAAKAEAAAGDSDAAAAATSTAAYNPVANALAKALNEKK